MSADTAASEILSRVERARDAVAALRDAAREGRTIGHLQRDPLVSAIHRSLDDVKELVNGQRQPPPEPTPPLTALTASVMLNTTDAAGSASGKAPAPAQGLSLTAEERVTVRDAQTRGKERERKLLAIIDRLLAAPAPQAGTPLSQDPRWQALHDAADAIPAPGGASGKAPAQAQGLSPDEQRFVDMRRNGASRDYATFIAIIDRLLAAAPAPKAGTPRQQHVDDGFGSVWEKCQREDCRLDVVRPGKADCDHPECPQGAASRSAASAVLLMASSEGMGGGGQPCAGRRGVQPPGATPPAPSIPHAAMYALWTFYSGKGDFRAVGNGLQTIAYAHGEWSHADIERLVGLHNDAVRAVKDAAFALGRTDAIARGNRRLAAALRMLHGKEWEFRGRELRCVACGSLKTLGHLAGCVISDAFADAGGGGDGK